MQLVHLLNCKMSLLFRLVFFAVFFNLVNAYVLPVQKCRLENSNCLLAAFQQGIPIFFSGIPELGVEKIETIDDVEFDLSGLKFTLKNGRVNGFKEIIIDDVTWNTKKRSLHIKYHTDSTLTGNYTAAGKILILPIEGDGQFKIKLKNIAIDLQLNYEVVKLAGKKDHLRLLKYTFQFDVKDHAEFHLTNLFKGNRKLSDTVLKFVNDNGVVVTKEFGRPLIEKAAQKVFKNVNILLKKLPLEDIAIV